MTLVLASGSPYRRAQFRQLGLDFRVESSGVDEAVVKSLGLPPAELAETLAHAKASAVWQREPQAVVIGCDQAAVADGRQFDKPGSLDAAIAQLEMLSGKMHQLVTAVAVVRDAEWFGFTDVASLWMRELTIEEITRYVHADQPIDCAGAYKWESRGPALFDRIACSDPSAIIGLPLLGLAKILRKIGYALP